MKVNYCIDCAWMDQEHFTLKELANERWGYCRKHKPVVYQIKGDKWWYGGWPLVDINDRCGEFRPKEG